MNRPIERKYNTQPNKTSFKKGHVKVGGIGRGDKMSESARRKVSESLLGKRGPLARNWQGGKTALAVLIRCSIEYKKWRAAVFERDGHRCVMCLGVGYLQADHIKPFAYFPELRFDVSNGRTLCRECHKKTDTYAYKAIKNHATA